MKRLMCLVCSILALFSSCEDGGDDYRYPSVITDYACLITDAEGVPEQLLLDNGCIYSIALTDTYREAHTSQPSYRADTVYRVISMYELGADRTALLYSVAHTLSTIPTPLRLGETLCQDPVYLQSSWLAGGYLNMVIELKALNGRHEIGFVDTTPIGMRGKEFSFYHDVHEDVEAYRQKVYASIPLAPFRAALQQGDTLRLVINTYDKGLCKYDFVM